MNQFTVITLGRKKKKFHTLNDSIIYVPNTENKIQEFIGKLNKNIPLSFSPFLILLIFLIFVGCIVAQVILSLNGYYYFMFLAPLAVLIIIAFFVCYSV